MTPIEESLRRHFRAADTGRCARSVELYRYAGDDLEGEPRARFEAHLDQCAECRADLDQQARVLSAWEGRPTQASAWAPLLALWRRLRRPRLLAGGGLAFAAAAAAMVLWLHGPPSSMSLGDLRPKGGWDLMVAVRRGDETFRASPATALVTGDHLGFFYTAPSAGYLLVFYVEESGEVTRLYPALGETSPAAQAGERVRLSDGAVLSPGRGCEWVVGLFSTRPLASRDAAEQVKRMVRQRHGCRLDPTSALPADARVLEVRR